MTETPADRPTSINIVGAGTMGSGIALAGLYAGFQVGLFDVAEAVLEQAEAYLLKHLERKDMLVARQRLSLATDLAALPPADLWLEAVPEDLELKRRVIAEIEAHVAPETIIATNTSTLSVTALAAAADRPQRVVGLHFFNPAAVLPLVEVIRAQATSPATIDRALAAAHALGKTPVVVADSPGFIVNRVARPFYGEALRLLGEGVADVASIDRAVESAGFKMGPFRLMDLIGIDINFTAANSVYAQTFFEPRFRPHRIQQQMVAQGALGRKTGSGFYDYGAGHEPEPVAWPSAGQAGRVMVAGQAWAAGLLTLLARGGGERVEDGSQAQAAFVVAGQEEDLPQLLALVDSQLPPGRPLFVQANDVSLAQAEGWLGGSDRLVGFDAWFAADARSMTLAAGPAVGAQVRQRAEALVGSLGRLPLWIVESPALILPRIVAMLVNEAAFAVGDGIAEAATIDQAMQLGANYPHGPLAWGQRLGWERTAEVLDHLHDEYAEERYRVAPQLRRWARRGYQLKSRS